MNHHGNGLQASAAAADFHPADERDVLETLARLTVVHGPLTAARLLFIPDQRTPGADQRS